MKRLDLGLRDSEGETAFDLALRTQNYTIATELLQGGADLNDTRSGPTSRIYSVDFLTRLKHGLIELIAPSFFFAKSHCCWTRGKGL